MDKEEIIRRLEKISGYAVHVVGEPPFIMSLDDGIALNEAIVLLKEQEPVKVRHLHGTKVTVHEEIVFTDECENCSGYLLKHWKACPICGKPVIWDD